MRWRNTLKKVMRSVVLSRKSQRNSRPKSLPSKRSPLRVIESKAENYQTHIPMLPIPNYGMPLNQEIDDIRPHDYDRSNEPDFWKPFFRPGEMFAIRKKIQDMILDDIEGTHGYKREWSICKLTKQFLHTYHVPAEREMALQPTGQFSLPHEPYFVFYNVLLCAALIVIGVISNRMLGEDYEIALKGGKAVQFVLNDTPNPPEYRSEDVDVLILPKQEYNPVEIKNVAAHLAQFLRWFLHIPPGVNVSVQSPEDRGANPSIYKLSYGAMYDKMRYKAFMDIDFKAVPEEMRTLYRRPYRTTVGLRKLKTEVSFLCPNMGALLDEKVFYYVKYFKYLKRLNQGEVFKGDEKGMTRDECRYMMTKFVKAIRALTEGLERSRGNDTKEAYKASLGRRLDKEDRLHLTEEDKEEILRLVFP